MVHTEPTHEVLDWKNQPDSCLILDQAEDVKILSS